MGVGLEGNEVNVASGVDVAADSGASLGSASGWQDNKTKTSAMSASRANFVDFILPR
jgi:hypothetical protein